MLLLWVGGDDAGAQVVAGGVQVAGSAGACSPLRMSLTSVAARRPREPDERDAAALGVPDLLAELLRRSAATSAAIAAAAQRVGDARRWRARVVLVGERDQHGARAPTGRRRATPAASSGTSSRVTPSEMPTPG